jgi:hypothetical protein
MSVGLQLLENILGVLRLSRFARDMERVVVLDGFLLFTVDPEKPSVTIIVFLAHTYSLYRR